MRGSPVGDCDFSVTDVEGSTRRWEADPGVCAAFSAADDAVAAAVDAQGRLGLPRALVICPSTGCASSGAKTSAISSGLECAGVPRGERAERVHELLGVVGLTAFAGFLPKELSGGMRQRVAIARALAPHPDLLLLDEPFGALDAQTKASMQEFIRLVWRRTNSTILMVTHDVSEAIYLSDRIYVLSSSPGRVAAVIDVPFGADRAPRVKREPRFLDLQDEIEDMLQTSDRGALELDRTARTNQESSLPV